MNVNPNKWTEQDNNEEFKQKFTDNVLPLFVKILVTTEIVIWFIFLDENFQLNKKAVESVKGCGFFMNKGIRRGLESVRGYGPKKKILCCASIAFALVLISMAITFWTIKQFYPIKTTEGVTFGLT